jgi:hypothetical protein
MDMKLRAMVILGWLLLAAGCRERCYREYEFDHPVSVYPVREAYHVGDTLWVEMHFPDVFDVKVYESGGKEFYESVQLKNLVFETTGLQIIKLLTNTIPVQAVMYRWDAFSVIPVSGNLRGEDRFGPWYELSYSDGMYAMKIGLVCNEAGIFFFNPYFILPNPRYSYNQPDITPECENEVITDIRFPVNRQPDGTYLTHYYLIEQYMDTTLEKDLEYLRNESFTFEVK